MTLKTIAGWFVMVLPSFMLLSCRSPDDNKLNHYINNIKLRPAKPIESLPNFKPLPLFIYPEEDIHRSPFKPKVLSQGDVFSPNAERPRQPLEVFPVDVLTFVGTLSEGSTMWAFIKQPDGRVFRAKLGDYMGQNDGQIISINAKVIQLNETIRVEGQWQTRKVSIELRQSNKPGS